jgi:hypothetical protein
VDLSKSFAFVFDDEDWVQKVLIGGILSFIPIVNLVTLGYGLRVLKNVAEGVDKPLPAWADFGEYFVKGLVSVFGSAVWALPIILLSMVLAVVDAVTGYRADPQYVSVPARICMSGFSCLAGLYGLFLGLVLPAAMTKYAVSGEFAAFFRFGEIFSYIKSHLGPYIVALLLGAVATFIGGLGVILCVIGVAFTSFWSSLVANHLLGTVFLASEGTALEVEI